MEAFQDKKAVKISPLCKLLKFLSSSFLLPLDVNFKTSKVSFSLLSCRTFIHAMIISLPWILVGVYIFLNANYYNEVIKAVFDIYSIIDIGALAFILGTNTSPLVLFFSTCIGCKPWAALSELSMDTSIKFPRYMKFSVSFIVLLTCRIEDII